MSKGIVMKKGILGLLLSVSLLTSITAEANAWGDWGAKKRGRVESAAICGRNGYIFHVRDYYYVAKYVSGKRFAVGVPVKASFGKSKWLKIEGLKNDGMYQIKRKYLKLSSAKAKACGLGW